MKRYAVLAGTMALVLGLTGFWFLLHQAINDVVLNKEDVVFEIAKGENARSVAGRLQRFGIVPSRLSFLALAYWQGRAGRIKYGEYLVPLGIGLPRLLGRFVSGEVLQHSFTIIEGWTVRQVLAALAEQSEITRNFGQIPPDEIMRSLGYSAGSVEGRLYPDTYLFPKGYSDKALLKRAVERMDSMLAREWQDRQPDLPLRSPYEALILASIVEKETGKADERARIAGVFVRRLQRHMRLQSDPTVIYGMGESYRGNISRQHLMQDTPYNTYTRTGLPPTPIAIPSAASVRAALHPERGESLYFVGRGDGSHEFSSSLADHQRAVVRYQIKSDE